MTPKMCPKTVMCDTFFAKQYMASAENLPHKVKIIDESQTSLVDDADCSSAKSSLLHEASWSDVLSRAHTCNIRKYLPPGNLFALYWIFIAMFSVASEAPGFVLFWKVYSTRWRKVLKFRQESQHSKCTTCWRLIQALTNPAVHFKDKAAYAADYQRHLMSTQWDRICYWSARAASRMQSDIVVIIIDAMDRSKTVVPRLAGAVPKALENLHRPCVQFVGAIIHGWATCLFVTDERCSHGSNLFAEVLVRCLDILWKLSRRKGRTMPRHLWVQADNAPSRAKNCPIALFLAWLVLRGAFASASMMFLQVGHTHEDIGTARIS